jgi:hypothetical protein
MKGRLTLSQASFYTTSFLFSLSSTCRRQRVTDYTQCRILAKILPLIFPRLPGVLRKPFVPHPRNPDEFPSPKQQHTPGYALRRSWSSPFRYYPLLARQFCCSESNIHSPAAARIRIPRQSDIVRESEQFFDSDQIILFVDFIFLRVDKR